MDQMSGRVRRYVGVLVDVSADGTQTPRAICWDFGVAFVVEEVLACVCETTRTGEVLLRYCVCVRGTQTFLWREGSRWFVGEWVQEMPES